MVFTVKTVFFFVDNLYFILVKLTVFVFTMVFYIFNNKSIPVVSVLNLKKEQQTIVFIRWFRTKLGLIFSN